jgi:hypothetical protein
VNILHRLRSLAIFVLGFATCFVLVSLPAAIREGTTQARYEAAVTLAAFKGMTQGSRLMSEMVLHGRPEPTKEEFFEDGKAIARESLEGFGLPAPDLATGPATPRGPDSRRKYVLGFD